MIRLIIKNIAMLHFPLYTLQGSNLNFKVFFSQKCKVLLMRYEGCQNLINLISFYLIFLAAFFYILLSTKNLAFSFIGSVKFDHITIEDGLSQNTINAILQDQNGFMWFATQDGLNKYDGYNFTYYKNNPEDANSLSDNFVYDIALDKYGIIWLGTRGQGLSRFDPKTEKFLNYRYDPNNPKGINDNFIKVIHIDNQGNIWLGTENKGISRFIPSTNTFIHYQYSTMNLQHDSDNQNNTVDSKYSGNPQIISSNSITAIYRDSKGFFWVGTKQQGLNKIILDAQNNIHSVKIYKNGISQDNFTEEKIKLGQYASSSIPDNEITVIYEDKGGNIWFGMKKSGLAQIINKETEEIKFYQHDPKDIATISSNSITAIYEDKKERLWVGTENGINILDKKREKFQIFKQDITSDPDGLSDISIMRIYEDKSGVLWIGTYLGGINKFSEKKFLHIKKDIYQKESLINNSIWAIFEDKYGIHWLGTEQGLSKFDRALNKFTTYQHDPSNPKTISNNRVQTILEDSRGLFWVGTEDGLNLMNRETGEFIRYYADATTPLLFNPAALNTLSENSIKFDTILPNAPSFNRSKVDENSSENCKSNILSDSDIMKIYEDREGLLWIATYNGGLNCFDLINNKLTHYRHDSKTDGKSINHDRVRTVMQDYLRNIWIGTESGLNCLDLKRSYFKSYKHDLSNPESLSNNRIIYIMEDSKRRLWLATKNGLNLFNREKETFTLFSEKDGLCNNTIYEILEDETCNLWLSTNKGLSCFNPNTKEFRNYTKEDGLQSNEFNIGAGYKNKNNEMFFGGINGFNVFNPSKISDNPNIPEIVLTSFKVFNKEVLSANELSLLPTISLSYKESFFSFEFAALDYTAPHKNQYAYQLVGFDNGWINCGTRRYVSYTNLDGGRYTFRVKGSNNDGVWNESGVAIDLIIPPPPWKSWWAYLIYIFSLIGVIYTYLFFKKQEYERKLELQTLHSEATILKERTKHQEEVERITRHDMKTPLNSIIGFPEILLQDNYLAPLLHNEHIELIQSIKKSGYIMLNMINLSLDMLKMENNTYTLKAVNVDVLEVIRKIISDLRYLANMKNIIFDILIKDKSDSDYGDSFEILGEELLCYSMFANIIKNAVEASPEKEKITITFSKNLSKDFSGSNLKQDQFALISIHNYGVVPLSIKETFFDKYATSGKKGGTGLGTYSAKLMAETLGGSISMTTDDAKGTVISVLLKDCHLKEVTSPYENIFLSNRAVDESKQNNFKPGGFKKDPIEIESGRSSTEINRASITTYKVLIVEDDEYNRLILKSYLKQPNLIVDSAENGKIGLEKAILSHYDLIFMDMEMPVMNGIEAVTKIREWEREHSLITISDSVQSNLSEDNPVIAEKNSIITADNSIKAADNPIKAADNPIKAADNPIIIVALSGHDDNDIRQKCINAGFDAYLSKPVNREHIKQIFINYFAISSIDNPSSVDNPSIFKNFSAKLADNNKVEFYKIDNIDNKDGDNKNKIKDKDIDELKKLFKEAVDACEEYNPDAIHPFIQELSFYIAESDFKNLIYKIELFNFDAVKNDLIEISKKFLSFSTQEIYQGSDQGSNAFEIDIDLEDLIPAFLDNKKAEILAIYDKLRDNDYEDICKIGHKIKGGFNMYGFDRLGKLCSNIENGAKERDRNEIEKNLALLKAMLENIKITYVKINDI
ncbi:putative Histidine kinase [Desulfamplus magnetovallimortis]|uniref:histidine kinase n=1 Tax=Desulfamplus magnetovallimortis TaxID=1246637 RepID=A0A1W1HHF1_9BACT|nr:two-component regulator propeller domain-containing protein [Desulfamplus magnetovallimortis]SLM31927.1 putative Histidine kinase [Desulfamplus magnetovallimortis]